MTYFKSRPVLTDLRFSLISKDYFEIDKLTNSIISRNEQLSKGQYLSFNSVPKIVNEYDQEIPQSQTADNPVAP